MGTELDCVVRVDAASASYDVHVTPGSLAEVGKLTRTHAGGTVAFIVSDTNVAPLYLETVKAQLEAEGYETGSYVFEAGEASKRATTWAACLEAMAEAGMTRDDVVVALGGGVVGDLAGFAAASYMRGCSVVQVPTSLLAMVDSSVGGKTAIDLAAGKNLAGAFWQPKVVIADPNTLKTINHELFTDSCGEVIKHGVLADPELFAELEESPINAEGYPADKLANIIARNVEIKRDVVNADERERGLRQTLNLGHTIGHAIEAGNDFALGHGSSVAAGMCYVARACAKLGVCPQEDADRIVACVAAHGLPTTSELSVDDLYGHALADKKRHGDHMNVVMVKNIGQVYVEKMPLARFKEFIELGA